MITCLLLSSCAAEEAKKLPPAASRPPGEGLIVYEDPVPPRGEFKKRGTELQPEIQAFTTAEEELVREHPEAHVLTGRVRKSTGTTEIARRLFKSQVAGGSVRLITQKQFDELWSRLGAAGLFLIPPYRGKEPPKDESYFLLRSGKKEWIFTRPKVDYPDPKTPAMESLQYWITAKHVLVEFTNEL